MDAVPSSLARHLVQLCYAIPLNLHRILERFPLMLQQKSSVAERELAAMTTSSTHSHAELPFSVSCMYTYFSKRISLYMTNQWLMMLDWSGANFYLLAVLVVLFDACDANLLYRWQLNWIDRVYYVKALYHSTCVDTLSLHRRSINPSY